MLVKLDGNLPMLKNPLQIFAKEKTPPRNLVGGFNQFENLGQIWIISPNRVDVFFETSSTHPKWIANSFKFGTPRLDQNRQGRSPGL